MDINNIFKEPKPSKRISKGAKRRAEKVNPIATEYQLSCMRRHFARLQRGFPNRYSEMAQRGRTKTSKPGYADLMHPHKKASKIVSIEHGLNIIDLFIRRGMRLQSKKVYRKPLVSGIKKALTDIFK